MLLSVYCVARRTRNSLESNGTIDREVDILHSYIHLRPLFYHRPETCAIFSIFSTRSGSSMNVAAIPLDHSCNLIRLHRSLLEWFVGSRAKREAAAESLSRPRCWFTLAFGRETRESERRRIEKNDIEQSCKRGTRYRMHERKYMASFHNGRESTIASIRFIPPCVLGLWRSALSCSCFFSLKRSTPIICITSPGSTKHAC